MKTRTLLFQFIFCLFSGCCLFVLRGQNVQASTNLLDNLKNKGYEVFFSFETAEGQKDKGGTATDVYGVILKDGEIIFSEPIASNILASGEAAQTSSRKEISSIPNVPVGTVVAARLSDGGSGDEFAAVYNSESNYISFFHRGYKESASTGKQYGVFFEIIRVDLKKTEEFHRFDTIDELFLENLFSMDTVELQKNYGIDLNDSIPWDYVTASQPRFMKYSMYPLDFSIILQHKEAASFMVSLDGENEIDKLQGVQTGMTFNQALRRLPYKLPAGSWVSSDNWDYGYDYYYLEYTLGRFTYKLVSESEDGALLFILVQDTQEGPYAKVNVAGSPLAYEMYYHKKSNLLQIIHGTEFFSFNLNNYAMSSRRDHSEKGDYYIELVQDSDHKTYLHTYAPNKLSINGYQDESRYKEAWRVWEFYFLLEPLVYTPSAYKMQYDIITNSKDRTWVNYIFINDVFYDYDEEAIKSFKKGFGQISGSEFHIPY